MKRYPPRDQQLLEGDVDNEESDAPWTRSVVPDAKLTTSGVFALEPPSGDVDLVVVLSDIVDLAGQLGLSVLHELSGLGFLPNGRVIPEDQQEMWEGAKDHAHSAKKSELKLTAARARKVFAAEIEPTLKALGFLKNFGTKGTSSYRANRWILKHSEIHVWYIFYIDQTKYGDVRVFGGGGVYFNCPLLCALWVRIDPSKREDEISGHLVTTRSVRRYTEHSECKDSHDPVVTSEDEVKRFAQADCTELLPWAATISTVGQLDKLIYLNKAEIALELELHSAVYYLCVAYLARNPNLRHIEANWVALAKSTNYVNTNEILAAIEYLNAHPLEIELPDY
jgi:hypothetical protein